MEVAVCVSYCSCSCLLFHGPERPKVLHFVSTLVKTGSVLHSFISYSNHCSSYKNGFCFKILFFKAQTSALCW